MGCAPNLQVLPVPVQRAIKTKDEEKSFILSLKQFDQNYDWYCEACKRLEGSNFKSFTLNFDSKVALKPKYEEQIIDSLLNLLNNLTVQDLVVVGKLDIFSNPKWKSFWSSCKIPMLSFQDRLKTQGYINFVKAHAENKNTTSLVMKRDFTLNDTFYMFYYLLRNTSLKNLNLSFIETGVENNSNFLNPNYSITTII